MTEPLLDELTRLGLTGHLEKVSFRAGEEILREGAVGRTFYLITEGNASVNAIGEAPVKIAVGSLIGELSMLTGRPRTRTVVAETDVRALSGGHDDFAALLDVESIRTRFSAQASRRLAANIKAIEFSTEKGFRGTIRPLLNSDRSAYMELVDSLSVESRRKRFFTIAPPTSALIEYLFAVDYFNHFAWIVFESRDTTAVGKGVAVVRFIRMADTHHANIALAVADCHQGQGLAKILLGAIGVAALGAGIETLHAEVLYDNAAMKASLNRVGASWSLVEPGVSGAELSSEAAAAGLADRALRLIIESSVEQIGLAAQSLLEH